MKVEQIHNIRYWLFVLYHTIAM